MSNAKTFTIMNTSHLIALAREGREHGFNRQLSEDFLATLDFKGVHIVTFSMIHNDSEMRVALLTKQTGKNDPTEVFLDMTFAAFNALPVIDEDKNLITKTA